MNEYELHAQAMDDIVESIGTHPVSDFTEADTRVAIIDKIFHRALGWPERPDIVKRELHVHEGYADYRLRAGAEGLVLEAKRVGATFVLPAGLKNDFRLSVKGLLHKQPDLKAMYDQVTRYAVESGCQFCILSNGPQWLIFPGVRTDQIHVRHSRVLVFNGFDSLKGNFVEFWNLLSFEAVKAGSLGRALLAPLERIEPTFLFNSEGRRNIPFDRNPLALVLTDVLPKYFGDLHGDPSSTDMLRECFVADVPVESALRLLDATSGDQGISSTLTTVAPVLHFYTLPQAGEKLSALISMFLAGERAKYFQVLVGRVGIGKTTFLAHFFDVNRPEIAAGSFVLSLDFRNVDESRDLARFFEDALWGLLIRHPKFSVLSSAATLRRIFAPELGLLDRGVLSAMKESDPRRYEAEVAAFLTRQFDDRHRFLTRMAEFLFRERLSRFVLVFDNVDQLDPPMQEKVIQFAYGAMSDFHALLVMSMWEETYFSSKATGRTLSTIRTVPIEIVRQSTAAVLEKRLAYLIKQVKSGQESLPLLDGRICSRDAFCEFLDLILRSLLQRNREVRLFLELVALGNIRAALEMFHAFLTAGSLDTRKIIMCMERNDEYLVPVHEFVKSVMLGSKRYYSERTSCVLNLFAIGDVEHPSHFTRLRLLQWLYERRHQATPFGTGFMTTEQIRTYMQGIGASLSDIQASLAKMTENALVENDLRARKRIAEAQALRITPTGRYYLTHVCRMFTYVDLVMQDTPFVDGDAFAKIAAMCEATDMPARFARCDAFIDYLEDQENEELLTIEKLGGDLTWRERFVPRIRRSVERTKQFIVDKGYLSLEREVTACGSGG